MTARDVDRVRRYFTRVAEAGGVHRQPFAIDGHTVVTDGHVLIAYAADLGFSPAGHPDTEYSEKHIDGVYNFSRGLIGRTPAARELDLKVLRRWSGVPEADAPPCTECSGNGRLKCEPCDGRGRSRCTCDDCGDEHLAECRTCNGVGLTMCARCQPGLFRPPEWLREPKDVMRVRGLLLDRLLVARAIQWAATATVATAERDGGMLLIFGDGWRAAIASLHEGVFGSQPIETFDGDDLGGQTDRCDA